MVWEDSRWSVWNRIECREQAGFFKKDGTRHAKRDTRALRDTEERCGGRQVVKRRDYN